MVTDIPISPLLLFGPLAKCRRGLALTGSKECSVASPVIDEEQPNLLHLVTLRLAMLPQ
jgi:hypothetical protein